MKLWAGRFKKETDSRVNDFNSSLPFDSRMYREDIEGSIAHATMLADCGIITQGDLELIRNGLTSIEAEITDGTLELDPEAEDIHMFIEAELTKRIGDAGKRLHTARSRNDQVAVDTRLYLKKEMCFFVRSFSRSQAPVPSVESRGAWPPSCALYLDTLYKECIET